MIADGLNDHARLIGLHVFNSPDRCSLIARTKGLMMINRRNLLKIAGSTSLAVAAPAAFAQGCGSPTRPLDAPSQLSHGWRVATRNSSGLNAEKLRQLSSYFKKNAAENMHSILIARHGELAFQEYYSGEDEKYNESIGHVDFGPEVLHDLRSMTKSVASLMFGIALDKGWIRDLDDPILSYLPKYKQPGAGDKAEITFRHALSMSSGFSRNSLPFSDPKSTSRLIDAAPDQCKFVLSRPLSNAPGAAFDYTNINPVLVGCAVTATTGKSLDQLVVENIFKPLGISKFEWHKIPDTGQLNQGWGLRMLPLDTLKIGQLILSNGRWKDQQIVSRSWIKAATTPQVELEDKYSYGYFVWTGRTSSEKGSINYSVLRGTGGQYLYIVPSLDLVVLLHAGRYKLDVEDAVRPIEMAFEKFILPSIKN